MPDKPTFLAECTDGVSQNFASPAGCATCTGIRGSSREKKNSLNRPSRTTVGAMAATVLERCVCAAYVTFSGADRRPLRLKLDVFATETDIDFSLNVLPFLRRTHFGKQPVELNLMDWRVLEPIEKIERFIL